MTREGSSWLLEAGCEVRSSGFGPFVFCLSMGVQTLKHSCVTGLPSGIPCSSFSMYTKEVGIWLKIRCGFNGEHIYYSEHSQKSSGKYCLFVHAGELKSLYKLSSLS